MSSEVDPRPATRGSSPAPATATPSFAVLLGLTGFAISQPLLSLAGANPTLFIFSRTDRLGIVALAVGIAFAPPILAWGAISVGTRLRPVIGLSIYRMTVGVLAFLSGLWVGREVGSGLAAVLIGVATATIAVVAIVRGGTATQWLRFTAMLPFLAVGLFLLASDSSALLRPLSDTDRSEIVGTHPSLIVVVFDELPTLSLLDDAGTIDAGRFPNFAALAGEATWYRNFTALSRTTETALPTMLTGRDPLLDPPVWTNYPDNLFSLLAPTHHLTVHEAFTRMCGMSTCTEAGPMQEDGSTAPADSALSELVGLWKQRLLGERTVGQAALDDFEESVDRQEPTPIRFSELGFFEPRYLEQWPTRFGDFLDALVPSPDPTLSFLHLLLPHIPWQFFADGTLYAPPPNNRDLGEVNSVEWLSAVAEQRHLLQLQYVDGLLGELVVHLKDNGMYDETALVVVADHGASFAPGTPSRDMTGDGRPGTAYVPLLVKRPGQSHGVMNNENLLATDFLPLLAELTNTRVDWPIDGNAPGSEAIEQRGTEKYAFEIEGTGGDRSLSEPRIYDGAAEFPAASKRWIRPWGEGDGELDALLELLDHAELIGSRADDLEARFGGEVRVENLEALTSGDEDIPPALIQGRVDDTATPVEILVGINGTIVTGSRVYPVDNGTGFLALLPSAFVGEALELEFIVATAEGGLIRPSVVSR